MSNQLIAHNQDLQRLQDEGYHIEVRNGFLLLHDIPYVNQNCQIKRGILFCPLNLAGQVVKAPETHVMYFQGEIPCTNKGQEIIQIKHASLNKQYAENLMANFSFSSKPSDGKYPNYYEKMTSYERILSSPAFSLDSTVTAKTFSHVKTTLDESPFYYIDTNSAKAGLIPLNNIFKGLSIAIISVGGSGVGRY